MYLGQHREAFRNCFGDLVVHALSLHLLDILGGFGKTLPSRRASQWPGCRIDTGVDGQRFFHIFPVSASGSLRYVMVSFRWFTLW